MAANRQTDIHTYIHTHARAQQARPNKFFSQNCCLFTVLCIVVIFVNWQVLSDTVANASTYMDQDMTTETRLFIAMMDRFFDCLNVKSPTEGVCKRKECRLPYQTPTDWRFKVCNVIKIVYLFKNIICCYPYSQYTHILQWLKTTSFLGYFHEWKKEVESLPFTPKEEELHMVISRETMEGVVK